MEEQLGMVLDEQVELQSQVHRLSTALAAANQQLAATQGTPPAQHGHSFP
jgi:hypothetical protein